MNSALIKTLKELICRAVQTSIMLFKIIIPVSLATRFLQLWGITDYIGIILAPVMELVGLPGETGLIWAASIFINIYGGMIVFASLSPTLELTVAQISVLGTMILIAHSLPVEALIARQAGARLRATLVIRISAALVLGWMLHITYTLTSTLQRASRPLWNPPDADPSWSAWMTAELRNMIMIFFIILSLMTLLRILQILGISTMMTRLLAPVMKIMGISREAAPITIIGMTFGISYGSGLIIQEARQGNLSSRDLFASVTLMGLCHGLIEDTLLMAVLGSHHSGILWSRIIFSLAATYLLVKLINQIPDRIFNRYLFSHTPKEGPE